MLDRRFKKVKIDGKLSISKSASIVTINTAGIEVPLATTDRKNHTKVAINATATATAAEVATGLITSTSAAPTTITMPTGTLLGGQLNAVQGTVHELYVDNTAGASVVTIASAVGGLKSDAAITTVASFGDATISSGASGIGRFTIMFSSPTTYAFARTA